MNLHNAPEMDHMILHSPIDSESFIKHLTGRFEGNLKEKFGKLIVQNNMWDFAIGLSLHKDHRVAFRGSWALERAYFDNKEAFRPYTGHFLRDFLITENPSVHRIYTKMLYDMIRRKILILTDSHAEAVAEKLFGLLIEHETKIAVKGWCMELLFDLSERLDWVEEPLREVVRGIMENEPSRAMANCGGKLLRRIDRRSKILCNKHIQPDTP